MCVGPSGSGQPAVRRAIVLSSIAIVLLSCAVVGAYWLFWRGVNAGQTLIEALWSRDVTESKISCVEILKFDPGAGWPFSEADHDRKARKRIGGEAIKTLLGILENSTTEGRQHRDHPGTYYYGILRIGLRDGGSVPFFL